MSSRREIRNPPARRDSNSRIRVGDFLRRENVVLDIPDDRVTPEHTLIRGEFFHRELRKGLFLHGGKAHEEHAFSITSSQEEGLSCIFFLDGEAAARFGDRQFNFRGSPRQELEATAVIKTRPESFQRMTRRPQYVRHLVVTATPEWLDLEGFEETCTKHLDTRLFRKHLAAFRWTPGERLSGLVQEILRPSVFVPELLNLYLEGHAVQIVVETLSAMLKADRNEPQQQGFSRHDRIRMTRARELIANNLDRPLSVAFIAREAGASPSGLQRLFRRAEGMSVFEYIRRLRLEQARAALCAGSLSVQEASMLAGYTSAANFATAFKRQFGLCPRDAMGGVSRRL